MIFIIYESTDFFLKFPVLCPPAVQTPKMLTSHSLKNKKTYKHSEQKSWKQGNVC